jgi:hypothetical protein
LRQSKKHQTSYILKVTTGKGCLCPLCVLPKFISKP